MFKALIKPFKKRVNPDKFCDKIAYVGVPPFRRRPSPFGERCSRVRATSATLKRSTQNCAIFSLEISPYPPKILISLAHILRNFSSFFREEKITQPLPFFATANAKLSYKSNQKKVTRIASIDTNSRTNQAKSSQDQCWPRSK